MTTLKAFLDTNALMGELSTELLLSNAEGYHRLFEPLWNEYVFQELSRHLPELLQRQGKTESKAKLAACRRMTGMRAAFPHAMVEGWEGFLPTASIHVSDPADAPILAGALAGKAAYLISDNLDDFDINIIEATFGLRVVGLSRFLDCLLERKPQWMRENLMGMLSTHRRPPRNLKELRTRLAEISELADFGRILEQDAIHRYQTGLGRMFQGGGVQGRDAKGRFLPIYGSDDDLFPYDVWGPDGNGAF